ncbi:hypothetical protein [Levilactobacillus enshiensis]|nr:hypothetical protein [Levilactobacillus enshiensis]
MSVKGDGWTLTHATTDYLTDGQQTNERMEHDTSAVSWGFVLDVW